MLFPLLLAIGLTRPSPVAEHGALRVSGANVVDAHGAVVVLKGCSLFWSQWQPRFWNADCVSWLASDWHATVVRAPVGVEDGGFLERPAAQRARLNEVIAGACRAGIYVIVDWHDHHANRHADAASAFFAQLAAQYGHTPNVIFEIFNEPQRISWSAEVKPYAERVIHTIRSSGASNLVIVGTPRWSQDVDDAAADPIRGANVAYALHFYAGTHKAPLRAKAERAIASGLPLFITEWGPCDASGDGNIDPASTREWFGFAARHHLSTCVWAVSDKHETASLVRPSASSAGHWADRDLTPAGVLARDWIRIQP